VGEIVVDLIGDGKARANDAISNETDGEDTVRALVEALGKALEARAIGPAFCLDEGPHAEDERKALGHCR
jgi:hypothetical protein